MPKLITYADTFRDWRGLIGATNELADKLPGAEPLKAELEASLAKAEGLKLQQETLESTRLATTKDFRDSIQEGQEKARQLRSFVVSVLGTRSELLKQFGLQPNRVPRPKSTKSKKPAPAQEPANPPAPEAAVTASAAPAPAAAAKPGF
jgi:hypothetical protein